MSFKYGSFDTAAHPWLAAKLQQWPIFPANTTVFNYPRADGGYHRPVRMSPTEWKFNLEITASNWTQAQSYIDQVSAELHKHRVGLYPLTPEGAEPWAWQALVSQGPSWKRDKVLWFGSQGVCRLSAEMAFRAVDPYGYAPEETHLISDYTGQAKEYPASGPTLEYYPKISLKGSWFDGSTLHFNATKLSTKGIPDDSTIVLDYATQDYYYQDPAGTRLGSVVNRLTDFARLKSDASGVVRLATSVSVGRLPSRAALSYRRRKI